jgi:hypothetical protein
VYTKGVSLYIVPGEINIKHQSSMRMSRPAAAEGEEIRFT